MNQPEQLWQQAILPFESTIQQAIRNLDQVAIRIILVVNPAGELQGTISDGDIRRGLLKGLDLSTPRDETRDGHAVNDRKQNSADPCGGRT